MIGIENLHLTIEGKDILKSVDLHLQTGVYDWMTAPAYLRWYGRLYEQSPSYKDLRMLIEFAAERNAGVLLSTITLLMIAASPHGCCRWPLAGPCFYCYWYFCQVKTP